MKRRAGQIRRLKRSLAMIMTATTLFTAIPVEDALGQDISEMSTEERQDGEAFEQGTENTEEAEVSTELTENFVEQDTEEEESTENTESTEDTEIVEDTEDAETVEDTEDTETVEDTEDTETVGDTETVEDTEESTLEYLIQYLVINEPNVSLNQKQQIVLSIACEKEIETAILQYHKQDTGEVFEKYFSGVIDNALLFEMIFEDAGQTGAYQLDSVTFTVDGKEYTESFLAAGMEAVFGVNQEVESNPDAVVDDGTDEEEPAVDIDVVRIDENGNTTSETSIEEAINNASEDQISTYSVGRSDSIVVVLDPGHDSTHGGTNTNGLREDVLNLKIAAYCKEELEQYQGVEVYLTRAFDGSCPYPGTTSGACNEKRVAYAVSVGADIYVSIHNNYAANSSANGAEVYYPNANYNPWVGATGQGLAQVIENHLVALGLYNRGIKIKDAQQDKYPDGSAADYYGVIRNSKLAGLPAIIIEHAFVSNSSDVNNFLANDEKLRMLGTADATAIAEYYGLSKSVDVTSGELQISAIDSSAGTALMSISGISPDNKIDHVSFAVWSQMDQSDLQWYTANKTGTGSYSATLQLSKHGYNQGTYTIDAYAYDIYGNPHGLKRQYCSFSAGKGKVTATAASGGRYDLSITGAVVPGGISSLVFAVWGDEGGQNDLKWYSAAQSGDGSWKASMTITDHGENGNYNVHAYAYNKAGVAVVVGTAAFSFNEIISVQSIDIQNVRNGEGTFDVVLTGVSATNGILKVQVPVWSGNNQDNIYWYTATRQRDGRYVAHVDIKNHKYEYGIYAVHTYVTGVSGITQFTGATTVNIKQPSTKLEKAISADETTCSIVAKDVGIPGGVKGVSFAVWSEEGGQDDLQWYEANNISKGTWQQYISIATHKSAGRYQIHAYGVKPDGTMVALATTTFSISDVNVQGVAVQNVDTGAGTFDVVVSGITSASKVSSVKVPVWCGSTQNNIYWYTAVKQKNGTYIAHVDIKNHGYAYGTYAADAYVFVENGIVKFAGQTKATVSQPQAKLGILVSGDETVCSVEAKNVGLPGGVQSVRFAVWSEENGQDDLRWYEAGNISKGTWQQYIPIAAHKSAGRYQVHAYGVNKNGTYVALGTTTFTISDVKAQKIAVQNVDNGAGTFDVVISGITSASGVSSVQVPVWSGNSQDNIHWYIAERQKDGRYIAHVDLKNHGYDYGVYAVHTYVTAGNGINQFTGAVSATVNQPKAKLETLLSVDETICNVVVKNAGLPGGIRKVQFAVWSEEKGQDDLQWYDSAQVTSGSWQKYVPISMHRTAGRYYIDAYGINKAGKYVALASTTFTVHGPSLSASGGVNLINYNEADGTFGVQVRGVTAPSGISKVQVAVWSAANQSDIIWYDATVTSAGVYQIGADVRNHQNNTGTYHAHAYVTDNTGISVFVGGVTCSMVNVTGIYHPIMGSSAVTVKQMADYYKTYAFYPSFYAGTEAPTIEAFCKIYMEEAQAEGVKAEVAFCQAMKETGFLKFGGNVSITQYNFAGLGSTGPGVAGESYPDVRTGIRAQIQHLKAYGCADSLNQACVDSRFKYVTRNTAPYVEWLGIQENPYGKGWATAKNYGYDIVRMTNNLKTY